MNWFKFLIYFGFFGVALGSIFVSILHFAGMTYNVLLGSARRLTEGIFAMDMIMGCVFIVFAGLAIFVRFRLAGFYTNGPKMLKILSIVSVVIHGGYALFTMFFSLLEFENIFSGVLLGFLLLFAVIPDVVILFLNDTYFIKRKHLFTR